MELRDRSIHELRGMAQAFGITDIFGKDAIHLAQEIELKQQKLIPPAVVTPPMPAYDARLMTKPPARKSTIAEITALLEPYISMGLKLSFDDNGERWFMSCGKKTDEGTMRMPLRAVLICAENVLR